MPRIASDWVTFVTRDDVVMREKIYRLWDIFYLTISTVVFFLEQDTIPGIVKCGGADRVSWNTLRTARFLH